MPARASWSRRWACCAARAPAPTWCAGRDEARVEAIVELPAAIAGAGAAGQRRPRAGDADEGLVVRRVIARAGRGRAHLGGSLATAADLARVVGPLIDIASQHDQQSLTDPDSQLAILDAFAENAALRDEMAAAHAAAVDAAAALATFSADARARAEREDMLRFQLGGAGRGAAVAGEDTTLAAERERLRAADRFFAATSRGEETLYAGDGAVSERIAPYCATSSRWWRWIRRCRRWPSGCGGGGHCRRRRPGPGALRARRAVGSGAAGGDRGALFLLSRLARKHGGTVAELAARREALAAELAETARTKRASRPARWRRPGERARGGSGGGAVRRRASGRPAAWSARSAPRCASSGSRPARLPIAVEARELGATGVDRVRFLFAPNPGEEPRPLAKIASGGELSRVMLAVKQALARTDDVLTYVFDEVDAGIGGDAAEVVGRSSSAWPPTARSSSSPTCRRWRRSPTRTSGSPRASPGKTHIAIEPLAAAERTGEIARMLAGASPSAQAAAHADEMLRNARLE